MTSNSRQRERRATGYGEARRGRRSSPVASRLLLLRDQPVWLRWGFVLAGLVSVRAVGAASARAAVLAVHAVDSRVELRKVVWPTAQETGRPRWSCSSSSFDGRRCFSAARPGAACATRFLTGRGVEPGVAMVRGARLFELRAPGCRVAQGAHQARRAARQVRRNPGADRGSRRDARRPEAQERAQVLSRATCWCRWRWTRRPGTW